MGTYLSLVFSNRSAIGDFVKNITDVAEEINPNVLDWVVGRRQENNLNECRYIIKFTVYLSCWLK